MIKMISMPVLEDFKLTTKNNWKKLIKVCALKKVPPNLYFFAREILDAGHMKKIMTSDSPLRQ